MISFIIIGRNEGWKLTKCLAAVYKTIELNSIAKYEVIYVDSKSTDDSIKKAKKFPEIKIYRITGKCNAAIGRNIGAKEASGSVLIFIDGDMEFQADFLPLVYNEREGLKYPFVSGQVRNFYYDENDNYIYNDYLYKNVRKRDKYFSTTGGIFFIERDLWENVGGMDNRFKRGQEHELGLRLALKGHKILRKKEVIANHHTISYNHPKRMWNNLWTGSLLYSNSFILRKHFFNPYAHYKIFTKHYSLYFLVLILPVVFVFNFYWFFGLYFLLVAVKTFRTIKSNILRKLEAFLFYIVRDISFIIGFFIPLKNIDQNDIKYEIIQND